MTATLARYDATDKTEEIAATLAEEGAVIVNDVIDPGVIDHLNSLVQPVFDRLEPGGNDFMGRRQKGVGALYKRGKEFSEHLLLNPVNLGVADEILNPQVKMGTPESDASRSKRRAHLPAVVAQPDYSLEEHASDPRGYGCHHYKLNVSGSTEIWGGGIHQPLHRENDIFGPYIPHDPAQPEYICFTNVAATDFTIENGATRLVPGSHKWPMDRKAEESEVAQAVMSKGSMVIWLGKTLHGLGASVDDNPRKSFSISLVVDWLATEENQLVATTAEVARNLPERAQQLLGYRASPTLGWVGGRDIDNVLERAS